MHTGGKSYSCPYCGHKTFQKGKLKLHIEQHKEERKTAPRKMPTQPLLPYLDGPEGLASTVGAQIENVDSSMSIKGTNTILHTNHQEKYLMLTEGCMPMDCMFCDQTFKQHEELGKHVLTQHRPTLCEPSVLCVEAEYLSPFDRSQTRTDSLATEEGHGNEDLFNCKVCGQTFETLALETHMKKHKDSFTYWCDICGRRFKEPWFLKNHRRTHVGKAGAKHKAQQCSESPVTINEVVQERVAGNVTTSYKMCMVCGFLFPNKDSLIEHSKIHTKESVSTGDQPKAINGDREEKLTPREEFFNFLNLRPRLPENGKKSEISGKWIGELDPFNTYQAWQLATKGKVAVSHGQIKEPSQEGSTDNDDSCSDKEELSEIWIEENGCPVLHLEHTGKLKAKKNSSYTGINLLEDQEKIKPAVCEVTSVEGDQKLSQNGDKPTHCSDCGKAFKTYHQLVLHSRVHKKDRRSESESSNTTVEGRQARMGSPDSPAPLENNGIIEKTEDGSEDGWEDGLPINSDKSEDGFQRGKIKNLGYSKECSYCGKSFRSNYYLNIHLRTHTGEKPYKCTFCEYAAAQKTSLRYHLDRHHKDKHTDPIREVKCENSELILVEDSEDLSPEENENTEVTKNSKIPLHGAKEGDDCPPAKQQKELLSHEGSLGIPVLSTVKGEPEDANLNEVCSGSIQNLENVSVIYQEEPKADRVDNALVHKKCDASQESGKNEDCQKLNMFMDQNNASNLQSMVNYIRGPNAYTQEVPLNLCIRTTEETCGIALTRGHLAISTCPFCTYKTFYPEVLMMHQKLMHKYNPDQAGKNISKCKTVANPIRRTGCPLSLLGKDVSPLSSDVLKTKAAMAAQSKPVHIERVKQSTFFQNNIPPAPVQDCQKNSDPTNSKSNRLQQNGASQVGIYQQQVEVHHKASMSQILDRMKRPELKAKAVNGSSKVYSNMNSHIEYPFENGPSWFSDQGREYLCNRTMGNFNLEFGEPSSKRVKPSMVGYERHNSDIDVYRRGVDMGRIHVPPLSASVLHRESLAPKNGTILASKPGLLNTHAIDPRWNVFIKSYEPHNPGPLYNTYGTSSSPMYSPAVEGKMTISYQHLPNGILQKRSYESLVGNTHYGTNDKNT